MEDPSSGNDRALNVELPGSDHDEEREARSRSDRSASKTAGSAFQGCFQDRGRPRSKETTRRMFRSPKGRQQPMAVDESWTYGRPTGPAPDSTVPTDALGADKEDEERRTFMAAYNLYISQTTALTVNGAKPFVMPVNALIDPASKQRIAEWDMGKDPYEVTETKWVAWFWQGYDVDPRALDTLKKRIKAAVVFEMSVQDAGSRIGKMLDGLAAAIRRDRQELVIKEESPAIVKIITDAVKPVSLHRAVAEQMALTRNKTLKKDVYRFVRYDSDGAPDTTWADVGERLSEVQVYEPWRTGVP
ncbi:hypothetical protein DYB35_013337, partial [Aphanomyces astaci]